MKLGPMATLAAMLGRKRLLADVRTRQQMPAHASMRMRKGWTMRWKTHDGTDVLVVKPAETRFGGRPKARGGIVVTAGGTDTP